MRHERTALEAHFAFGENWSDFAGEIDERRIREAERALVRLFGNQSLAGASFLDVGCGSGIHAVAALRCGARSVTAVDIDPKSVGAARRTLEAHAPTGVWEAEVASVFDLDPAQRGQFDVVYSWGMLHHTGAVWKAVGRAAGMVSAGGLLALALYRKTALCGLWKMEKRLYVALPSGLQRLMRVAYISAFRLALAARGRDFSTYIRDYAVHRGMEFRHDVHDWLGGWPYEPVRAGDLREFVRKFGFDLEREFLQEPGLGLFGSGNDEFVFRKL